MSAPTKKRATGDVVDNIENSNYSESDSDDSSNDDDVEEYTGQQEIQVEFEGRIPNDADFHGIKQLLHQLFLKAHVNLSELTDIIISQNYIGSVVKQSELDYESDDDDDNDDGDTTNDVFGITSVINITEKQNLECVQQLRSLLVELSSKHAIDQTNQMIRNVLGNDAQPVGLIINERFVNIPAQISVPLLENLSKEIKKAKEKKMPFDFSYYLLICKLYKTDLRQKKKKNKRSGNVPQQEIIWSNPEEEVISEEVECQFEFCVKDESDTGLSGQWLENDDEMIPYRRVFLFRADKLDSIIHRIKAYVS